MITEIITLTGAFIPFFMLLMLTLRLMADNKELREENARLKELLDSDRPSVYIRAISNNIPQLLESLNRVRHETANDR